jgi:GMP synthase (glutamine-hydrolysing)
MTSVPNKECVLIFDFGSQYAQLIARRVREQNVFCQLVRANITPARVRELKPIGIIFSGGPASVYENGAPHCDPKILDLGIPVLGICYGMQLAVQELGGKVVPENHREFGRALVTVKETSGLFEGVPKDLTVWMSHGDQVQVTDAATSDFLPLASTETCPVAAMRHRTRPIYGLWLAVSSRGQPHAGRHADTT